MSHFWSAFANQLRDCGRGAAWFLVALSGIFVLTVMEALALQNGHGNEVLGVATAGGVLMIYHLAVAIRRAVQWRRHRLKFPQLSSDELNKARTKLTRRSKPAGLRGCDAASPAGGRDALVARSKPGTFSWSGGADDEASPTRSATGASQPRAGQRPLPTASFRLSGPIS